MTYQNTGLYKAAFQSPDSQSGPGGGNRLAQCLHQMRDRAAALVKRIQTDLPHMTIHDVTHLDALWEMADIACGDEVRLNEAEAFVFGGAVLLHDAAMTLAAFPDGLAQLQATTEWKDMFARHSADATGRSGDTTPLDEEKIAQRATADALRLLHAKQAEELPKASWLGPDDNEMFLIEDQQVRNFYGGLIGKIAHSHWWSIDKVENELAGCVLGALPRVTNCSVDRLKIACLLRIADAMHLDQRRAPAFDYALTRPAGISSYHWKFQSRMAAPIVNGDALLYTAQPPFSVEDADAWWTAFDALQLLDRELRDVDRLLRDRQMKPLLVRRVDGIHSPEALARKVETVGWSPVDSTIRVSDVPKIVAALGGSKLYGEDLKAPVRELIQNGLDAIRARRKLEHRAEDWGELKVILEQRGDEHWFCIEDTGVGMSTNVLTGPLIDFGNSFWRSSLAMQEFPGLAAAGMEARGKYGIGFFSVFMLGDHVRVITRRYDRDKSSAQVLEFKGGLGSRPILRHAAADKVPLDGGTRVEVKLNKNPEDEGGVLFRNKYSNPSTFELQELIGSIAPAADVAITMIRNGKTVGSIAANDWLEIDDRALQYRISGRKRMRPVGVELAKLCDGNGNIYGRACIEPKMISSTEGLVTVGGLASTVLHNICGIFVGLETTAARNQAHPIVTPAALAAWASRQASAIAKARWPDQRKALAAITVLACGGDVGALPIICFQDRWLNADQFKIEVRLTQELFIYNGEISHDSSFDDIGIHTFENNFAIEKNVCHTMEIRESLDWVRRITSRSPYYIHNVVESVLQQEWDSFEEEQEEVTVGHVEGVPIKRDVTIYTRVPAPDPVAD